MFPLKGAADAFIVLPPVDSPAVERPRGSRSVKWKGKHRCPDVVTPRWCSERHSCSIVFYSTDKQPRWLRGKTATLSLFSHRFLVRMSVWVCGRVHHLLEEIQPHLHLLPLPLPVLPATPEWPTRGSASCVVHLSWPSSRNRQVINAPANTHRSICILCVSLCVKSTPASCVLHCTLKVDDIAVFNCFFFNIRIWALEDPKLSGWITGTNSTRVCQHFLSALLLHNC